MQILIAILTSLSRLSFPFSWHLFLAHYIHMCPFTRHPFKKNQNYFLLILQSLWDYTIVKSLEHRTDAEIIFEGLQKYVSLEVRLFKNSVQICVAITNAKSVSNYSDKISSQNFVCITVCIDELPRSFSMYIFFTKLNSGISLLIGLTIYQFLLFLPMYGLFEKVLTIFTFFTNVWSIRK